MKYFSVNDWDKWRKDAENEVAYRAYIETIQTQLPSDLQLLLRDAGTVYLNDGEVESISVSIEKASVDIVLNGKWIVETTVGDRIFHLAYTGVVSFVSTIDPAAGGIHGSGYGFHGIDEMEVIETGIYEHRMLFTSGIELAVRFRGFSLTYVDPQR